MAHIIPLALLADPGPNDDQKEKKTCKEKYPNYVRCNDLPYDYQYNSPQSALEAFKKFMGVKDLKLVSRDRDATAGPCVGKGGKHYNVNQRGQPYPGSVTCCPCCKEDNGQPKLVTRCRFIRK